MGTVSKALSLLTYFSRSQPLIGLSDLARLSGMNKATTYRLLGELQQAGFVEQVGTGREYRLGATVLRLASLREAAVPMREVAQTELRELSEATGETAHFSVLQGDVLSAVSYAYSAAHGTRVTMEDAEVLPLHATSSGLAVLAFSAPQMVDRALSGPLPARTARTMTDPDEIRRALAPIRQSGIAESISGFEEDVHSHAAPIFDAASIAIGAIAVAAPVARMDAAQAKVIRQAVQHSALRLTRALGGFVPDHYPRPAAQDDSSKNTSASGNAPALTHT